MSSFGIIELLAIGGALCLGVLCLIVIIAIIVAVVLLIRNQNEP